jgi:hypothetical protein
MMKKERIQPDLQHGPLKQNPFRVPAGYFESFPDRLMDRISRLDQERVPVRKLVTSHRVRIAIAAAIVGLALISYPVVRIALPGHGETDGAINLALMEEMEIFNHEYELAGYLQPDETPIDEEEAYLNQAIEYLAQNDVEMDLIFE